MPRLVSTGVWSKVGLSMGTMDESVIAVFVSHFDSSTHTRLTNVVNLHIAKLVICLVVKLFLPLWLSQPTMTSEGMFYVLS